MAQPSTIQYRAFISYSHADRACASWLHRTLEDYRVPAKLVGAETVVGPVPRRLRPIFRDREELPASGSLGQQLEEALAASMFLVVVCSPAAAQSRWVNEEIRVFKQRRGGSRVLAVIAEGEPFASRLPGREAEECFPPALRFDVEADGSVGDRPVEPIAADLRPGGDGRHGARLKLVAGLIGVRLDDLVRREAQKRLRRLTAIATAASLVAVSMTGLTAVAIDARGDAEERRDQAEGLIEFMLGDLRQKLEPVGRLEALDGVGEKALDYYSEQEAVDLDPDALGRRSRALHLIGEVRDLRGDSEGALASFRQAAATTAELLAREPGNGRRIFDHAQSVFWVGYVAWQRGERRAAEVAFREYRRLSERLVPLDPANLAWRAEPGHANINLGVLWLEEGKAAQAAEAFARALAVHQAVLRRNPDDPASQTAVAQGHAWLADAQRRLGNYDLARQQRAAEAAIYRAVLHADPKNTEAKQSLLVNHDAQSALALDAGDIGSAVKAARLAVRMSDELSEADPENLLWVELGAGSRRNGAESLAYAGDPAGDRALSDAVAIARRLADSDPTNKKWQVTLLAQAELSQALLARQPPRPRLAATRDVAARLERHHRTDPDDRMTLWLLAKARMAQGDALAAAGRGREARTAWEGTARLLEPITDAEPQISALLAAALVRLGRQTEASRIAAGLDRLGYRHPFFQRVGAEIRAGGADLVMASP